MSALRPWLRLLTRFEGRISLRAFWVGLGLVILVFLFLSLMVLPLLIGPRGATAVSLVLTAPLLFAVTTKRLHDRDRSWLWNLLFGLPIGFACVSHFSGLFPDEGVNAVTLYWGFVSLLTGAWSLRELGFRAGVPGYNEYGPDPLEAIDDKAD